MRRVIIGMALVLCGYKTADRTFQVSFTQDEITKVWNDLRAIRQIADESNLPHQQAKFVVNAVDSIMVLISKQVNTQVDSSGKKRK